MLPSQFLTFLWLFLGACYASNDGQSSATKGVRCFDCDYDYVEGEGLRLRGLRTQEDATQVQGKSRGFRQCAFIRNGDRDYVSDTQCSSGTCFIRKDTNGLVYRGCADQANLPIRVNTSVNCQPQGPDSSIWWFCRGSLCNSGAFGSGDICWAPGQPPVAATPLAAPARTATGKTIVGKLSKETFEQIQARAGFGNLKPVEYGGSGLNSEQTIRFFRNQSAIVERGMGNLSSKETHHFQGGQNSPSGVSTSWHLPASTERPVPAPTSNWPKSWNSVQSQHGSAVQQAVSDSRLREPQLPAPTYKTWNPDLENGRASPNGDQQQRTELKPPTVDVGVPTSSGYAGSWDHLQIQSQSSGSHGGSSSVVERPWIYPAVQPSGSSGSGQNQQQGESTDIGTSGSATEIEFIFNSRYNPCDGICADNPSGLYNHPSAPNWFVQCGPGFDGGVACQCCRPHYQQCPRGTFFSSAIKICDEGSTIDFNAIGGQPFTDRRLSSEENTVLRSSAAGRHSNYIRVPVEGQNVAQNERVQSWSGQVEVSPLSRNQETPSSGRKSWAPQGFPADQSSKQIEDSSFSASHVQSGSGTSFSGIIPPLKVPDALGSQQQQYQQQGESAESRISESEAELQFILNSRYNPCDGLCDGNPSGLYNHPSAPNWFIQCGPGFDGATACQCCRPHYQQCPRDTFFSSATKVCDERTNV